MSQVNDALVGRAVDALKAAGMDRKAEVVQLERGLFQQALVRLPKVVEERACGTCAYRVGELKCALPLEECNACQPPAMEGWAPDSVVALRRLHRAAEIGALSWSLRYALGAGIAGVGSLYMIQELNPKPGQAPAESKRLSFLQAAQACVAALVALEGEA